MKPSLIYQSKKMEEVLNKVEKLKGSNVNVNIIGETGVGKEMVARLLNEQERDTTRRFVPVNCAAIPENLTESILFGHERGSFTGAVQRQFGKFELANDGDIFLDEVNSLPLWIQSKLLRVLQEKEVDRIGANRLVRSNFRVISAASCDLSTFVDDGLFRADLFYRLCTVTIKIPPLRERKDEIKLLAEHFLRKYSKIDRYNISENALKKLKDYDWPGNVRELEHTIYRAAVLSNNYIIDEEHIIFYEVSPLCKNIVDNNLQNKLDDDSTLRDHLSFYEKELLLKTLLQNRWNKGITCEKLGISRNKLYKSLKSYNIDWRKKISHT